MPVPLQLMVTPETAADVLPSVIFPDTVPTAAATYGPTNGPPAPTGAAPAGLMNSVLVSASARARLIRPLPVCDCVPAGSALRARRPTMIPLVSVGPQPS